MIPAIPHEVETSKLVIFVEVIMKQTLWKIFGEWA
jgi:hypothetical protein